MQHTLLLFDIDGTLLNAHGIGLRSMQQAGCELFGESFTFDGVQFAGRLDNLIFQEAALISRLLDSHLHHDAFHDRYIGSLAASLGEPDHGLTRLPGVLELLELLRRREAEAGDVLLGMLTGNYQAAAALKLRAAGIDPGWFRVTAFASEADSRPGLTELALKRYRGMYATDPDPQRVIVIGDTPHDVHCAKTHGCIAFAVATGHYTVDDLRAAGADHIVSDLTDPQPLLRVIDREA